MTTDTGPIAIAAAQAFIDAFNAQDHAALANTLNYPHTRLAIGRFMTFESAEDFIKRSQLGKAHLEKEGWHHTVMKSADVIHSGDDKVHLSLHIERCHEDGTVYNRFDTLWIVTLLDGHWGVQFRSSFLR
jgi:hypothetical protein